MPGPYVLLESLAGTILPLPETQFDSADTAFALCDPPSMFDGIDGQPHWLDDFTPETPASTPGSGGHSVGVDLGQQMRDLEMFCDAVDNSACSDDPTKHTAPLSSQQNLDEPGHYRCKHDGCKRSYQGSDELMRHQEVDHQNHEGHICEFCGKEFFRKNNLNSHRWRHARQGDKNRAVKFHPGAFEILSKEGSVRTRRSYLTTCSKSGYNERRGADIDTSRTDR